MVGRALYFAYGSNLSTRQMAQRCADAAPVGVAVLRGHRLAFTRFSPAWGGGVADAVVAEGDSVWGLLYELTPEDLAALDGHEGGYERVRALVETLDGRAARAWAYRVADKADFTPPTAEYLGVIRAAAARLGFPDSYLRLLDAVPTAGS